MKGVFLHEGVEYRLEVAGDTFRQGDAVPCTLVVKNHAPAPKTIAALGVGIALGHAKKVKEKAPDAFEMVTFTGLSDGVELTPSGQQSFHASFELEKNAPVTDKAQGLFAVIGTPEAPWTYGQLPLGVQAHPYITSIAETLDTVFQFVPKGVSSKAGWTTFKMKPPSSRRLSFVEELNVSFRFEGEDLETRYVFTVKKFDTGAVKIDVRKGKAEVQQRWDKGDYLFGGQFIQQPFVERSIDEALATVSSGL